MFKYREAREGDASSLAERLRDADKAELIAMSGDVLEALRESIQVTPDAFVAYIDDPRRPEAAFGVAPSFYAPNHGVPWFLGTDVIEAYPKFFIRESRRFVSRWQRQFPVLSNWVDSRNTKRLEWLQWLGFTLGPVKHFGPDKVPFFQFYKVNPCVE